MLERINALHDVDVLVLGGGVNGACLYDSLCRQGYRVLLADKHDFASGTSQASGMMIWGGLLYLRNLDLANVFKLSLDRDRLIDEKPDWVKPEMMHYLPHTGRGRAKWWVQSGLWLYWLMGLGRRRTPTWNTAFNERDLLKPGLTAGALCYEEAAVLQSDARFVLAWLVAARQSGQIAMNYCDVAGEFNARDRHWHVHLTDTIGRRQQRLRARLIVNCTGVWADKTNAEFAIESNFRHVFSKGVYLGLPRSPAHLSPLFFDLGEHADVISLLPWGPISLWGPTETAMSDLADGAHASTADVDFLLAHYARRFQIRVTRADIISLRCGIRPLVVDKHYRGQHYPLDLSRREEVVPDATKPWVSCYGGKLTGCRRMAARAMVEIAKRVSPSGEIHRPTNAPQRAVAWRHFPGLTVPVPTVASTVAFEYCTSLADYLRRRTNIAQWVAHGGFGRNDCNATILQNIATEIAEGDATVAARMVADYREQVMSELEFLG